MHNRRQGWDGWSDGIAGQNGIDGADGQDGQDGEDGNANVISSDWIAFDVASWSDVVTIFGLDQRIYPVTVPEMTEEIANTVAILGYVTFAGLEYSYSLPFVEVITGSGATGLQDLSLQVTNSGFNFRMFNTDGNGDPGTFGSVGQYRYVIIPPVSDGRSSMSTPEQIKNYYTGQGLDLSDYSVVAAYSNLDT